MLSHFSQALQSWRSAKASAALAIIALAIGIGATTAIFTVINGVMLSPVPYTHGERWVSLLGANSRDPEGRASLTVADLLKYQSRTHSFDVFGWLWYIKVNLTSPGAPQHLEGIKVTAPLVNSLGISPAVGHWFTENGGEDLVVISSALWQRLGADPNIVGKAITLSGRNYTVTGVMPPSFVFPLAGPAGVVHADVWLPLDSQGRGQNSDGNFFGIARRKAGISVAAAQADVARVAAEIAAEEPATHPDYTAKVDGLLEIVLKQIRPTLLLLFAAAGVLLLITCANVAGLLLARSISRARETAIRVALGATRGQLARQYFLEGLVVSIAGAAGGVLASMAFVRYVVSRVVQGIPRGGEITVDARVLLFTALMACLASAIASLAPLWQAFRTAPNEVLNEGVRSSTGSRGRRLSFVLVVAEIALSFVLLSSSAVLLAQLRKLNSTSPGFLPDHLLTFEITMSDAVAGSNAKRVPFQQRLLQAVSAIPGVTSAAFINNVPLTGCCYTTPVYPQERQPGFRVEKTSYLVASSNYIETMRIPLRRGRLLTDRDTSQEVLPILINETAARLYWPNRDAVGAVGRMGSPDGSRFQVVGVVGDVRNNGLGEPVVAEIYLSGLVVTANPMFIIVRSALPADSLAREVARAVQTVERDQPIHNIQTMAEIIHESTSLQRRGSLVATFFAAAALMMASLGIYGVVAYSTRQRTVEMGTRMALGAEGRDLLRLIVGSGLRMALVGIVIGGVAVAASAPFLMRALSIQDIGLFPFLISTAIVAGIAPLASFFPAWRATLLSPMVAIRSEPTSMWQSAITTIQRVMERTPADEDEVGYQQLSADFAEALRQAASFREGLQTMLTALCIRIGAKSAYLLESDGGRQYRCETTTGETCGSVPADGFLLNRLRSQSISLPISAEDFDSWLRWARKVRPQYTVEIEMLQQAGARMAVPLRTGKEILGVLLIGSPTDGKQLASSTRGVLQASAMQFALMLENERLTSRIVEQEKLRIDLALAAEVQKRLLPQQVPASLAATFAAVSMPARSVGGDYYDFLELPEHRIGMAIADVSGKGVAAALLMSLVQASLRLTASDNGIPLAQLAVKMNVFLKRAMGSNRSSFATFFYATFDGQTRELRYVNAGHNPPLVVRTGGIEALPTKGFVLGMFPKAQFEEGRIELSPGDVLFAFTDGVNEARSRDGEEFGDERLHELLQRAASLPAGELAASVSHELKNWMQDTPPHDDITFIVMKVSSR